MNLSPLVSDPLALVLYRAGVRYINSLGPKPGWWQRRKRGRWNKRKRLAWARLPHNHVSFTDSMKCWYPAEGVLNVALSSHPLLRRLE